MNDSDLSTEKFSENQPAFEVSDALALFNQILETATPTIAIVGEIANFKVNQNKWVFFDLKDASASLGCFMSVFNLRTALEDGMRVLITARPGLTKWGKFSLTVQSIKPVGEGSIRRAFELLRAKLDAEGLFAPERKRALPELPQKIAVISSIDAAGYKDFIKILGERIGGISIKVAPVQVQGDAAAEQITAALKYFNEQKDPPEIIAILRGGGSRDDLAAFDYEKLVRAIAASRVSTLTGIGHEIDTTLADLAADQRASTPSNAAEILVPDKREILAKIDFRLRGLFSEVEQSLFRVGENLEQNLRAILAKTEKVLARDEQRFALLNSTLQTLNPREILRRGYAIVRDEKNQILRTKPRISDKIVVENMNFLIDAKVENVINK